MANKAVAVTRKSIDLILIDQFRVAWLDLHDLPRSMRNLALLGYISTGVWLIIAIVLEAFASRLPSLDFVLTTGTIRVPILAVIVASASFALGWAYIMTGATECRTLVLVPIAIFFLLQITLMAAINLLSPGSCVAYPLILALLAISVLARGKEFFRKRRLLVFGVWFVLLSTLMGGLWVGTDPSQLTLVLNADLGILTILALAYWVVSGLGIVDVGVSLSGIVVGELRRLASQRILYALVLLLLILRPVLALALQNVIPPWWVVDFFLSAPIWIWALVITIRQRWNARLAALVIGTSLATTIIIVGLSLVYTGHDFGEVFLSATGLIPPILLTIGMTLTNLIGFGARYISTDGRNAPRTARVLLLFGIIALVFSFMLFKSMSSDSASFDSYVRGCVFFGLGLLGPMYLIRIVWKHSGRLLGEEHDEAEERATEFHATGATAAESPVAHG